MKIHIRSKNCEQILNQATPEIVAEYEKLKSDTEARINRRLTSAECFVIRHAQNQTVAFATPRSDGCRVAPGTL